MGKSVVDQFQDPLMYQTADSNYSETRKQATTILSRVLPHTWVIVLNVGWLSLLTVILS